MMINKRLIGTVGESKKYIAGNVACQWVSLAANISMMAAIARMLQGLYTGTAGTAQIMQTALIAAAAIAVCYGCSIASSRMSFLSSRAVKKKLRHRIYEKLLRYAEQSCNHFIAFKLLALIRDKVFGALRRLCPAKLEGKDKGDLISVITSDIELLEVFYAHTISPICIAFLFCLMMVLFIGRIHTALGVLALSAYAVVGIVIPLVTSKRSGDDGIQFRSSAGKLSAFVLDSLRGLPETVQYGQGRKRLAEMDAQTDALSQTEAHMKRTAGKNTAAVNTTILLFDLAMLFSSAKLAGFEGCLIATLAMMSSFGPVVSLAALGATLQNTFAAGNRVLDILDESPVAPDVTGKANVEFHGAAAENVSFSYGGEQILEKLSLSIPEGKVIGITGRSGSGKSTLLKLFMRFWPVTEGKVTISGKSVDKINTENLRDMESFVTQQTHLFHDSIRKNLCIAKLDATEEEIIAACKKASVHDFIMGLPKSFTLSTLSSA